MPQATSLFCQALSSMVLAELQRLQQALPQGASGPSASATAAARLEPLLRSRTFNASLLACAAECVAACYQMVSGKGCSLSLRLKEGIEGAKHILPANMSACC